MIVLAIHTAGPACEVTIWRDGHVVAHVREAMLRGQDVRLPDLVAQACDKAGMSLNEINRFAVVTGPGSFTGVRVGVSFARGLALATGAPCLGITSLEAALPQGQQGSAIVILPAQRRAPDITYWTQRFRSSVATGPAEEMRLEDLAALLTAHPHMVYGNGAALIEAIPDLHITLATPSATRAAELAAIFEPPAHPPRPTYARAPDALLPGGKTAP
jgi:tRNA threonylcarbamoyladenosine biosynthesis protein TsaB